MLGLTNNSGYATLHTNPYALAPGAKNYDTDDDKAFIWRLGYEVSDQLSLALNGLYGGDCATEDPLGSDTIGAVGGCGITYTFADGRANPSGNDKQLLLDFTMNWDPSDKLSTWVNVDYMKPIGDRRNGNPAALGIAAAGRYGITDNTGISLRGEYIYSKDNYIGLATPINFATIAPDLIEGTPPGTVTPAPGWYKEDQDIFSLTATLDHALTEHLKVKAEVVYQQGSGNHTPNDNQFFCNKSCQNGYLTNRQVLLGAQMTYEF